MGTRPFPEEYQYEERAAAVVDSILTLLTQSMQIGSGWMVGVVRGASV
jgi:hypothetical protein